MIVEVDSCANPDRQQVLARLGNATSRSDLESKISVAEIATVRSSTPLDARVTARRPARLSSPHAARCWVSSRCDSA